MLRMKIRLLLFVILLGCGTTSCDQQAAKVGTPMITEVRRAPWHNGYSDGIQLTSRRYVVYATTSNRALLEYFPGFMEAAYENYLRITGIKNRQLTGRMTIYLMGSRSEWAALTKHIFSQHAGLYLSLEAGGYCHKGIGVFWDIGGLGTLLVAAHEGLHQFFYHRLKDQLPMWLEEGLCVTAEGYEVFGNTVTFTPDSNPVRFNNLRTAIVNGHWIPLAKLLPMDGGDVVGKSTQAAVGYYGQLWALAYFIRTDPRYRQSMARMLADAEAGRFHEALDLPACALGELRSHGRRYNRVVSEQLFRHYISDDLDAFDREFYQFAKKLIDLQ